MASNYIKKVIQKNSNGTMKNAKVDIIPEVLKETHIISADSATKIVFFNPSDKVNSKNYNPGTQNLFKQNTGFVREVHFRIFDLNGASLYDRVNNGGAAPDRIRKLQKVSNTATVIHKLGEFEIIRDEFYGYIPQFPNVLELASSAPAPIHSIAWQSLQPINHLSKSNVGVLGFKYPGKEGLRLTKNEQWTIELELSGKLEAETYGMQIQAIAIVERATDGAV